MAAIEEISLPAAWRTADLGTHVASITLPWLAARGCLARDAIVLVPFAALIAPLREAFVAAGGWQPRVETALTLAASLGPPPAAAPGQCSGDPVLDRLAAGAMLLRQPWARELAHRDAPGFDRVAASLVEAAQALREGAQQRAPAEREAWWRQVHESLPVPAGPAAAEAALLRLAADWAAEAAPAATDRAFALRPAAWVVLRIGGPDAIAEALAAQGVAPALRLQADPPPAAPFEAVAGGARLSRVVCEDFESEAQACAACVLEALAAGQAPVALVALDRALVRRIRALLARRGVPLVDETGWVLATTRAAAGVLALLKAAESEAPRDARLAWLKEWPAADARALDSLEALWRERRRVPDREAALALEQRAAEHLRSLSAPGALPLARWLVLLRERLAADGSLQALQDDAAGSQVIAALRLLEGGGAAWQQASAQAQLSLAGFTAWARATLEQAPFLPTPDVQPLVVLTPLARAFGRPFGHVVLPGTDHQHLGSPGEPPALIGEARAAALGLEHAALRRQRQQAALAHLLRAEQLTLLRRHRDEQEPLADSPLVEWLLLERARNGQPPWPLRAWQPATLARPREPVPRPLPTAAAALPAWLSATQLEALRACPYRFFGKAVLRLDEADELDAGLAKRDYGNWLHAVLHRFHAERDHRAEAAAQLEQAAVHVTREMALDEGELLPWRASFDAFVPAYLAWVAAREAAGWYWADGESEHRASPPELPGVGLLGRIDRLDHGEGGARQVLDYKTGSATGLAAKVKTPLEDTQLAFYAALLGAEPDLGAAYVAVDGADAPRLIEHPQVHETAHTMLVNLGQEWQRLREGAPLPALGEGPVCEHCEMRGLCRRDHWSAA